MIKLIISLLIVTVFATAVVMTTQSKVYAVDVFEICDSDSAGDAQDSAVCSSPRDQDVLLGTNNIVTLIANLIAAVGGLIAVVMVIYNGLQLIMSSGDSAKVTKARTSLIYLAVGIVILVLARTIVYFVQSSL